MAGRKVQGSCSGLQDVPSRSTSAQRLTEGLLLYDTMVELRQEIL